MRKVEQDMLNAIAKGRSFSRGNTSVLVIGPFIEVYLHGNLIARQDKADAQNPNMQFTLAGWNTPTTRSRLNALGVRVYTKKGQAYANGFAVESNQWFDKNGMAL